MNETEQIVYLNGRFLPAQEAMVPVMDRGFLFGDGVYEVIPVFGNHLLRMIEHLQRLQHSLDRISLHNPMSQAEWQALFESLLERNPPVGEQAIYLQISRGVYPQRDLALREGISPTVFMMTLPVLKVDFDTVAKGIRVITIEDFRWDACDIKSTSLVANVMLREQASQAQVEDAILVKNGWVTEGTASNLFLVKDGKLITPPTGHQLLSGITRGLVIDLAGENDLEVIERPIESAELTSADELWLTSSTREIAPVVELDGQIVSGGSAGPVWKKMVAWYQQKK